jgi:oxygen-independent coproporphyrinogen-3 oxidase
MVYLHVPFCRSFCTYCDFYSEIACRGRDAQLFEDFTAAVCAEASLRRDEIEATRDLNTLYIGGGTPSVLPPIYFKQLLAGLTGDTPWAEFTVEVNPEDIVEQGPDYVRALLDLGVTRVSMGVQSLDDGILRWMNRRHDAARARQAFRILRDAGVKNISVDLIFGLSQLSEATLTETLREIVAWRPEHVSAYQLSIEEGSALGKLVREGRYEEASQEQCAAQYRLLCDGLRAAGYGHYEISNWALPGFEAIHNSAYWTRHPYVGLGPGAHSFDGKRRFWNSENVSSFAGLTGESLTEEEIHEETVMLGLRTARGVAEGLLEADKAAAMLSDGRLERLSGGNIRIPENHWFVSDDIIADLL